MKNKLPIIWIKSVKKIIDNITPLCTVREV